LNPRSWPWQAERGGKVQGAPTALDLSGSLMLEGHPLRRLFAEFICKVFYHQIHHYDSEAAMGTPFMNNPGQGT
jgi:hypothetical protein